MFKKSFLKNHCNIIIANKTLQNCVKKGSVCFLLCPKQGLKIEGGVLHRVYILGLFCPKQGQGLKPSVAPLYPTIGQLHPPPPPPGSQAKRTCSCGRSRHTAHGGEKWRLRLREKVYNSYWNCL